MYMCSNVQMYKLLMRTHHPPHKIYLILNKSYSVCVSVCYLFPNFLLRMPVCCNIVVVVVVGGRGGGEGGRGGIKQLLMDGFWILRSP